MFVKAITQLADLLPYQQRWDELAGDCVFRSWLWLSTWWNHYGQECELYVLLVFSDETESNCSGDFPCRAPELNLRTLVGILPAYRTTSCTQGRVLRLLGDGEVCSENLDLLCEPARTAKVANALTAYLTSHAEDWDVLRLCTVAEAERNLGPLLKALTATECDATRRPGANCWSIPLPGTWEEFLAMQSKSHRKQLKQLKSRVLESPRAQWFSVEDASQFDVAWEVLIDLHQRRRQSLGEPGCFASPMWANFHRQAARELLAAGQLRLSILELDRQPIAAEYHLAGNSATYAYQGGIDPDRRDEEPGQLSMIHCIDRAISEGHQHFELLRGDEPYKAHWRAEPTATVDIEVVSPRMLARVRHYSWNGLRSAGRLVRQFTNLLA
jgi:CelD/BcsL family acetyltransferase involved in cellulose biosynthesis